MEYPRWSEWRKWDLHLHTASSYDYKYKWEDSDKLLIEALRNNFISAVAITDHFLVSKDRIENLRSLAPEIVFFPGVELRTDKGDTNIHIILIFNNDIDLNNLCEDFNSFKRNKAKNLDNNDRIYRDFNDIIEFAKNQWALISIHAWHKSNWVDDRITNVLEVSQAVKEEYAKNIDIFEMGQIRDLNDYKTHVFPTIWEKPMIICSDNHNPEEYSCNLWIKADLTFEWLKQILYEPDRVKNQDDIPEAKESYLTIDKVSFVDNDFMPTEILLSKNLTTIIWWKSTWKSILLRAIAETIDKNEVEQRLNDISMTINTKKIDRFNVLWWDWQSSSEEIEKKIIYIPQSYLNRITEDWKSENAIIDIIVNILKNDPNINQAFEKLDQQKRQIAQILNKNIEELFFIIDEGKKCSERIKNIWDKKWIENEINSLGGYIDTLKKTINLSSEELELYNNSIKEIGECKNKVSVCKKIIEVYEKLQWLDSYFLLDSQVENYISECPRDYKEVLNQEFKEQEEIYIENIKVKIAESLQEKKEECDKLLKTIEWLEKKISPLIDKIAKSEILNKKINKLNEEKKKLASIEVEESLKKDIWEKYKKIVEELAKNIASYHSLLMSMKDDILNQKMITEENGLSFNIEVKFDFARIMEEFVTNVFDQRKNILDDCKFTEDMDIDQFEKTVKSIITNVLHKNLPVRSNFTEKEVITKLAKSWYFFNYKIIEDWDELNQMSPWKKSYVLLKLLIELDNSKCPILLDQPEDDLDNRSIYQDLARFIKEKKKSRQFIIATHNPNLVVGTDAECIIVANQEWNKSKNKNYKFEYVQWSLENTKQPDTQEDCILYKQGIQEHICEILEWWKEAFEQRKNKYSFINNN